MRNRPPRRDRAAILYERFVRKSRLEPLTGETPQLFALRAANQSELSAETVNSITETYLDARYGPPNPALLQKLESEVMSLR